MQRTPLVLTLQDVIKRTEDLPSMVVAALGVVQECDSERATASSVGARLGQDPALTVRVLRLANSPFYGLSRPAANVQDAVLVLGMRTVRSLCLIAATYPWLTRSLPGYSDDPKALWTHSFATAVGARLLAKRTRKVDPEDAFTAGLLHDIGKIALASCFENKRQAKFVHSVDEPIPFDAWERETLGFDHTEAGYELAQLWNLPKRLALVTRFHHQPYAIQEPDTLVDIVHLADTMALMLGFGLMQEGLRYEFDEAVLPRLGLADDQIEPYAADLMLDYVQQEKLFEESGMGGQL